jgi:hypothetical protein
MIHIVIAIIVAIAVGYYFYSNIDSEKKSEMTTVALKAGLPGIASGVIAFYVSKTFISSDTFKSEPTMQGSFFDP